MITFENDKYYDEEGTLLHTGHNIEWNRKVNIDMNTPIWFGAFKGKTSKDMFGSSDGTGYLNWMKKKGFTFTKDILETLEVGKFVHTKEHNEVPDFLVANNKSRLTNPPRKPKTGPNPITDEITLGEPMLCTLGQEAFVLFDQDLADTITQEGRSILAEMVDKMANESRNIITANPEAGRNYSMIY
jgi:hypothetical protein